MPLTVTPGGPAASPAPTAAPFQPTPPAPATVPLAAPVGLSSFTATAAASSARANAAGASIVGLRSPMQNSVGRITFEWEKPGDVIPFELTARVTGDPARVSAQLHTNANHNDDPDRFDDLPMKEVRRSGGLVTYRVDVPIQRIGNYRATAKLLVDGKTAQWASEVGLGDLRFRARAEAHNALDMRELNIQSVNRHGHGTLEDLMGNGSPETDGKYTLEFLKDQGINAVWVMPPFKRSKWDGRHPMDDAGSPYATKNYLQTDPEFSDEALKLRAQGKSEAEVEAAANATFKRFVDKAHSLGMKVVVDVALNHVGHNYEFADYDLATRQVKKNDFSQFVDVNSEQGKRISQRLADPNLPDFAEYVAPELLYASRSGDRRGARSVSDTMAGGGQWLDTKQLKLGGPYGPANPEGADKVVDYLTRVMQFWVVEQGVDGFRLDHLTGLPQSVLDDSLNRVQAASDKYRGGAPIYFTGEDFFNAEWNAAQLDSIQDTWLRNALLENPSPATFKKLLLDDYFKRRELLNINSHDETRFDFHGDMKAAGRMNALLQLLGGTAVSVAGDEYGEGEALAFRSYRPVPVLERPPPSANRALRETVGRAGRAREALPALHDDNTYFLQQKNSWGDDPDLLPLARLPDAGASGNPVFVFANFNNSRTRENAFQLDGAVRDRIDPNKRYQLRDLMADDPRANVWGSPLSGRELRDGGLFARLAPYQVQVLELSEA